MTRKPLFWILFALASGACGLFAWRYFAEAFPIVTVDLKMDREAALASARRMAEQHKWGPAEFRQAASYGVDAEVQSFVELEAGGTEAFRQMIEGDLYSPYKWEVRHFRSGETTETRVLFTPAGEPYGFQIKLPEDEPGAALPAAEARALAEREAAGWRLGLDAYQLIEQGQEVRPGGRVDHTLVYERPDVTIGDGRYRLRLVVAGDRLGELKPLVHVPEAFSRRYEEMRSANNAIAAGGVVGMGLLLVAAAGGLFYLLRQRWVQWRPPLTWGIAVSVLMAAATLNFLPLKWMSYDTALSPGSFALQQAVEVLAQFLGLAALYWFCFMVAESLSRRAFPHQIQLWRAWSRDVATSPKLLGYTLAGYLLVPFFWAYEVGLYFLTTKGLGWYNPSSSLFEPDLLATYFPWLTSIAISLQAGFWEECLFRAVPIAGAALLGLRFGHRRLWIAGALVLGALCFGAGHANYPAQPAYARLVELILPAVAWGLVYLVFGLLPVIVTHFAIDVSAIGLPVFVSSAPGAWIDKAMIVAIALVPLWIVLAARWRSGAWRALPEERLNRGWMPPAGAAPALVAEPRAAIGAGLEARMRRALVTAGLLGLAAWAFTVARHGDAPPLDPPRDAVMTTAREQLAARAIELETPWKQLAKVQSSVEEEDRYVWQEGGEELYRQLLGNHLPGPHWTVRFARFEGDVAERAEEYQVAVAPDGTPYRLRHVLPEARAGASLSEEEARALAVAEIEHRFGLAVATLEEISAVPAKRPQRTDWTFTYKVPGRLAALEKGQARVVVEVAGDEVADASRQIHVPEEWQRRERDAQTVRLAIQIASWLVIAMVILAGVVRGIVSWSRGAFSRRTFLVFFAGLAALNLLSLANGWPQVVASFSTAQPYTLQAWMVVGLGAVFLTLAAAGIALMVGFVHAWSGLETGAGRAPGRRWPRLALGLALGSVAAGLATTAAALATAAGPAWGNHQPLGSFVPLFSAAIAPLGDLVELAAVLLLILTACDHFSAGWTRRRVPTAVALVVAGLALTGTSVESLAGWWIGGLVAGVLLLAAYVFVLRFDLGLVPAAVAALLALRLLGEGLLDAYPGALAHALLAAGLLLAAAAWWTGRLSDESPSPLQSSVPV